MRFLAALMLCLAAVPASAHARHWHRHYAHHVRHHWHARHYADGRPRAWCGYWMRHNVSSDPGVAFNLARNWLRWGHPVSGPAPGVIGVMPHHVFKVIEVVGPGRVLAISGNDGHAVRTRVRSTRGVIGWRA